MNLTFFLLHLHSEYPQPGNLFSEFLRNTLSLVFHLPLTSKTTATDPNTLWKLFSPKVIMHSSLPIQWTLSSLCRVWRHWSFLPGNSLLSLLLGYFTTTVFLPPLWPVLHCLLHVTPFTCFLKCLLNTLIGWTRPHLHGLFFKSHDSTFIPSSFRFLYLTGYSTSTSNSTLTNSKPYLLYALLYPTCFSPWTQSLFTDSTTTDTQSRKLIILLQSTLTQPSPQYLVNRQVLTILSPIVLEFVTPMNFFTPTATTCSEPSS